jgi:diaminopimelate decarboxylase
MLFGTQTINSKGHLEIGGCDTAELAAQFGTPLYVMDEDLIRSNCRDYIKSFRSKYPNSKIAFAGKAFLTAAMTSILRQEGMYLDVVSAGEIHTAVKGGFPTERIYFHGNFKSASELKMALQAGVGRIVVDNMQELELLSALAAEAGKTADILFRLTPGIDPHTHKLIRTGQADTKFGLNIKDGSAMAAVTRAQELPGIHLTGIHCHVGSQCLETDAHTTAVGIMVEFAVEVYRKLGITFDEINTGGGLGISYTHDQVPPTIDEFASKIADAYTHAMETLGLPNRPTLVQEPGRSIIGTAGTTLYTVGTVKTVPITEAPGRRTYVAVDGGMSDNPRPALYGAVYEAHVANNMNRAEGEAVTISGKHCETDILISDATMPKLIPGDILAVKCTGAYNYSMSSNYNRFTKPAVVLVSGGRAELIVKRETLDDLVRQDVVPDHLKR